ncbi:MAG TPA: hypothetical protein DDX71_04770 [Ruminococcus sp.]|nr:hypothetical protein [Ruminococcus sp.]
MMRDFLLNHAVPIAAVIGLAELLFAGILFADARRKSSVPVLLMGLIASGLAFDALVIAGGHALPAGILLILSRVRFLAHGLFLPLCIALCGYVLDWVYTKKLAVVWLVTVLICAAGGISGFVRGLELREFAGLLRYVSVGTPVWAEKLNRFLNFGTVIPLIAAGIAAWIRQKNPCIFFAGFLMFLFSALGPATGNADLIFLISMAGEICMAGFFLLYEKTQWRDDGGY